jgi:hypothetical protein
VDWQADVAENIDAELRVVPNDVFIVNDFAHFKEKAFVVIDDLVCDFFAHWMCDLE